jgi:hypothetical protein
MVWVKFHDELRRGAKRGIPRAYRFVLLELSLEARPGRGAIDLPLGMSDTEGVCDILGGNRREILDALKLFTAGPDPVILFQDSNRGRQVVIPSWSKWNSVESAGSSTQRSRRHRRRPGDDDATKEQRPRNDRCMADATAAQRSGNGPATPLDQSREEKINTPPAGARAREVEPEPSEPPTSPLGGAILAELRRWPVWEPIASAEVAESLALTAFDRKRTPEAAARCLAEGAAKAGARAAAEGPLPVGELAAFAAGCVASGPRESRGRTLLPTVDHGSAVEAAMVLDVFADAWARGRRQGYPTRYTPTPHDARHAAELWIHAKVLALPECELRGLGLDAIARELVAHWASAYMREDGARSHLVEARHPLHLLERNIPSLGTPRAWGRAKQPRAAEPASGPPPAPDVPPPPDVLAAMRKLGRVTVAEPEPEPEPQETGT